ncbi:6221_t:CDS:2, partial [Racocetra fulgida]
PNTRKAYQRSHNNSWFVIKDLNMNTTLELHQNLILACDNIDQLLLAPLDGYICLRGKDQNDLSTWLPLLVGWTVYTKCARKHFKLSIEQSNNILVYSWNEYYDDKFNTIKAHGQDKALFYSLRKKYNLDKNYLFSHVLGIAEPEIATELCNIVKLKRASAEIEAIFNENNESDLIIQHGIQLTRSGIPLSSKSSLVLLIKYNKTQQQLYQSRRQIKRIKASKFVRSEVIESYTHNSDKLRLDVQNVISNTNFGFVILVNTEQYITLIYTQPCSNCSDFNYSNYSCSLSKSGFLVKCEILCQKCNTITESSNQSENENLSKYVLAAALAGGINQNTLQTVLACIGITAQADKTTYFDHQTRISQSIINHMKQSTKNALNDVINYLLPNANSNEPTYLSIGFDVSWSHSRNAKQANIFENERIELLGFDFDK